MLIFGAPDGPLKPTEYISLLASNAYGYQNISIFCVALKFIQMFASQSLQGRQGREGLGLEGGDVIEVEVPDTFSVQLF